MKIDTKLRFYLVLMTIHTSLLIASNAAGAKIFALPYGLAASATVISYMLTFVILDTIAELYGRSGSRFVIIIGLASMAISVVFFQIAIVLPPAPFWGNQAGFEGTLGSSWRILLGGWTSYIFSQFLDLWSFLGLKNTRWGSSVSFRAWISMVVGQFFDTLIFMTIAFYGAIPLTSAISGQYLVKVVFATIATPLVPTLVILGRKLAEEGKFGVTDAA